MQRRNDKKKEIKIGKRKGMKKERGKGEKRSEEEEWKWAYKYGGKLRFYI